jgi:hypothetical protein
VFIANADWLPEAYAEPINVSDVGYVSRNLSCQARMQMFIELCLNPPLKFLDYAAGYGLFVRLMRDIGYDFRWADKYCRNLFAQGFEEKLPLQGPFEAVTAFEVMEHMSDPMDEIEKILPMTECFVFSTLFLPTPTPAPHEWWYYGLDHGQHISFYTRRSLELIGKTFGYHLISDGNAFHVLTTRPITDNQFRRIGGRWWRRWIRRVRVRPSLTSADHEKMRRLCCQ